MLLQCISLQKAFGTEEILRDVSFILEEREKAALVGVNGAGKTSVFRLITGEWSADTGQIIRANGTRLGYLPQLAETDSPTLLYDELKRKKAQALLEARKAQS